MYNFFVYSHVFYVQNPKNNPKFPNLMKIKSPTLFWDKLKIILQKKWLQSTLRSCTSKCNYPICQNTQLQQIVISNKSKLKDKSCVPGQMTEKWTEYFAPATIVYAVNTSV